MQMAMVISAGGFATYPLPSLSKPRRHGEHERAESQQVGGGEESGGVQADWALRLELRRVGCCRRGPFACVNYLFGPSQPSLMAVQAESDERVRSLRPCACACCVRAFGQHRPGFATKGESRKPFWNPLGP